MDRGTLVVRSALPFICRRSPPPYALVSRSVDQRLPNGQRHSSSSPGQTQVAVPKKAVNYRIRRPTRRACSGGYMDTGDLPLVSSHGDDPHGVEIGIRFKPAEHPMEP